MFKSILWDNDGILVQTEKWYYEATKETMQQEGFDLTLDIYRETFLKNNIGAWHLLNNNSPDYIASLRIKRNNLYSSFLNDKDIFTNNISTILKTLYKKYKMGIVTSSRKEHFDIIHKRNNLLKYFDFIICNEDYSNSKPDPEPYLLGLKNTGFNDYECVVIEDSERGVISAKRANLFCIAIPTEMTCDSDFRKADIILDDINDIYDYL